MFFALNVWKVFIEHLLCQVPCFISLFFVILTTLWNDYSHFIGKQVTVHKGDKLVLKSLSWVRIYIEVCLTQVCTYPSMCNTSRVVRSVITPLPHQRFSCEPINLQTFFSFYIWWYITNQRDLQAIYPWED